MGGAKLVGLNEAKATILGKIKKGTSKKILNAIGQMLVDETTKRMENNEIKPSNKIKTREARRKRKRPQTNNPDGKTLVDIGSQPGGLLASIRYQVKGKKLSVGTNQVYARIHQFGGRTGRKRRTRLPARPFLFWTFASKVKARRMIMKALKKG